ncbi:MAG: Xaa-Pro peptidase family protein [Bacillota bacterium]|nr:Xaa-Pro peptidase family protein [Bacillota bacterium]
MYKMRIKALREAMQSIGIDGVLIQGDANRNYLSGFTGDESYALITNESAVFITDSRYTEQAKNEVKDFDVVQYSGIFADFLADLVKKLGIKKLGFEENIVSYGLYSTYKSKIVSEWVPLKGAIEEIRIIKDESEIEHIRKAAAIADQAFDHMLKFIKVGMKEREIALELEYTLKKLGAKALSFPSIVASGERSCLPHGQPSDKIVDAGEFLTLDFGCIYEEYCSDMTRTLVLGNPSDKMIEIYNVVLEAQTKAAEFIKEGLICSQVDEIARKHITDKGYGSYFGHGLGHGVGREIHEEPRLSPKGNRVLKAGMIVTDEPGIYIPGFGGVRIEDLIVVRKDGCEILSKSPKNLICI